MESEIEAYAIYIMICWKRETMAGRELQNQESIRTFGEKEY